MRYGPVFILVSLLSMIIFSVRPAEAQLYDYGLKGGLNYSTITQWDNAEYYSGLHMGAFLLLRPPFSPIGIQPEVLYTRLGAAFPASSDANGEPDSSESLKIDYLQFPLLLKYYFAMPGPLGPHLYMGPYLGLKAKVEYPPEWGDGPTMKLEEMIREQDYGLVIGAGMDIHLIVATFQLDARFIQGIQKVFQDVHQNGERHRAATVSVGFAF